MEVGVGVDTLAAAGFYDGVEDGAFLSRLGCPDEEPVLFSDGGRTNGIFNEVVVDLHPSGVEINSQGGPDGQRVADGLAQIALGKELGLQDFEGSLQAFEDGAGCRGAISLPQGGTGFSLSQQGLRTIERRELIENEGHHSASGGANVG